MKRLAAIAALLAGATLPALADCKNLKVENAWIPQAPPVAPVLAGYARLVNDGDQPLRIDTVEGADFGKVELHQMSMDNGMMKMRPLHGLDLPAHGSVTLADGGKHLMLMNPRHPFKAGDSAALTFHCGKDAASASFTVREAAP